MFRGAIGQAVRGLPFLLPLALIASLSVPVAALAYVTPPSETTATPVVTGADTPLSIEGTVTLSPASIEALASAIASASAAPSVPATVSIPGTLTVDPWETLPLPEGSIPILVALSVGAIGWVFARSLAHE